MFFKISVIMSRSIVLFLLILLRFSENESKKQKLPTIHNSHGVSQICSFFFGGRGPPAQPSSAGGPLPPSLGDLSWSLGPNPWTLTVVGGSRKTKQPPTGGPKSLLEKWTGHRRPEAPLGPASPPSLHGALWQGREKLPPAALPWARHSILSP